MYVYDEVNNCWVSIRTTSQYKQKKKIVRNAWLVIGTIMLMMPPTAVMVTALFTTFMSFMLLDESVYSYQTRD